MDIDLVKFASLQKMQMKPKAVRAVAAANGFNRISIIVPCHRIIGKNGKMMGYGGGIERKNGSQPTS